MTRKQYCGKMFTVNQTKNQNERMIEMVRLNYHKEKAVMFTVNMPSKVEDYALVFLQMFNSVREYPQMLYRIENNSGNSVFITCNPSYKGSVREWIESFDGVSIEYEERVDRFIVGAEYNVDGYNEIFEGKNDVQFYTNID